MVNLKAAKVAAVFGFAVAIAALPIACSSSSEPTTQNGKTGTPSTDADGSATSDDGAIDYDGNIDLQDGQGAPTDGGCLACGKPM